MVCISTRRNPPEEECDEVGSGDEEDEDEPGPPEIKFLLFFLFFWRDEKTGDFPLLFFCLLSLSFVWRPMGIKR